MRHWHRGEVVVLRYGGGRFAAASPRHRGTVFGSPHVVVQDRDDLIVLYQPAGTGLLIWDLAERRLRERLTAQMDFLRLLIPTASYAVVLAFDAGGGVPAYYAPYLGGEGRFRGWKVDLQTPVRRTAWGFASTDEVLDLMVKPDRSRRWKDEERLAGLVELGLYTRLDAERIRQVGCAVIPLIEAEVSPFDERWTVWHPTPDLAVHDIPDGWQEELAETGPPPPEESWAS